MKGNTVKTWITLLLLAVCVWWMAGVQPDAVGLAAWDSATSPSDGSEAAVRIFPMVKYDARDINESDYGRMIAELRGHLTRNQAFINGIPVLPSQRSTLPEAERYVLVEMTGARGVPVTFAINTRNVYVVAYVVGSTNTAYFFQEAPADADGLLFRGATVSPQRRSSSYQRLEREGGARTSIPLGLHKLKEALKTLAGSRPEDAQSLLVVIQMVSEAVRYWEIEWRVRLPTQGNSFEPDQHIVGLENNWGSLSRQIQRSDHFAFERPITIGERVVDNINSMVIRGIFLMLFQCDDNPLPALPLPSAAAPSPPPPPLQPHLQMLLSTRPEEEEDDDGEETCGRPFNPTRRIMGRDGLCVDVKGFIYRDNNPVVVYACRDTDFKNQLWTFKEDGRIMSMDKCLAATGSTPGSSVVIHDCDTLDDSAIQWTIRWSTTSAADELINTHSKLLLTANDVSGDYSLTLETDAASSFQAWKSTTTLSIALVSIHGADDLCIYHDGAYGVYTEQCMSNPQLEKWRLYPDGTIRPAQWQDGCLELKALSSLGSYNYIQAGRCDSFPEYHRWTVTRDGFISNLKSGLVVHADKGNYLKAAHLEGGLNQIWTLRFL